MGGCAKCKSCVTLISVSIKHTNFQLPFSFSVFSYIVIRAKRLHTRRLRHFLGTGHMVFSQPLTRKTLHNFLFYTNHFFFHFVSRVVPFCTKISSLLEHCLLSKLLCWHTFFGSVLHGRPLLFVIDFSNV